MSTKGFDPQDKLARLARTERHAAPLPSSQRAPQQPAMPQDVRADADRNARDAARPVQPFSPQGPQAKDVRPGVLVRRDTAAALAALAGSRPDLLQRALQDHRDGTFSVRFLEQGFGGARQPHVQTVDGYLPANALAIERGEAGQWERLWPAIVEKAYAAWKGSYAAVGPDGRSGEVLAALTGANVRQVSTLTPPVLLWHALREALSEGRPVTCTSGGGDDQPRKRFTVHVVVAVREQAGEQTVVVRDPLGGNDEHGPPDIAMPLAQFRATYDDVSVLA